MSPAEQHPDSKDPIIHQLTKLVDNTLPIRKVYVAAENLSAPALAWQIDIPRIDIVLSGTIVTHYSVDSSHHIQQNLEAGDVVYFPAKAWSQPMWQEEVTILSLMISPHKVGFSLQKWNGEGFTEVAKRPTIRHQLKIGNGLLQALEELGYDSADHHTISLVIRSLLSHIMVMSKVPDCLPSRQEELFQKITGYIDQHFDQQLNREMIAEQFYISVNYLSHIFQQQGKTSFKDYLCHRRLDKAQTLLAQDQCRIKQISEQCGFTDSNYFCRLFKQKLGMTPSQFRAGIATGSA
ncbi:AraC family transcriptional regulator [Photobacterium rosenbergii]|uniref:AraC family transcriptional regulator n=1 Tax=Photobacterium rosenbergii TaxID=294936 RepID=A0ABU3ZHH5_9GAMM|nr:AraC family transcriptional regulator [Photobacterium rosenbergii]MDV5169578.1 AraC family transcriptional regulator [Photobacterium rosenbergii]